MQQISHLLWNLPIFKRSVNDSKAFTHQMSLDGENVYVSVLRGSYLKGYLLLKVFKDYSYQLYLGTLIMLTTGSRNEEIVSLTWNDTDIENRAIYFKKTKSFL